jgi:site-specific DNA recombinase
MNCAIYIRKSREEKDKHSHRLTVQREQLPAYAITQGWACGIYDDGHASAARGKTEDLKERSRLEADIRAGKIGIILTIELSRLSRDDSLQDYVAWLHLCSEKHVKLATMSRILDPNQHSDWMLLLMEGGFSSVEMRQLQARMAEGRAQAVQEGKFLGGQLPPPYVHGRPKTPPVIDPFALERLQVLWSMSETMSSRKVGDALGMPMIAVRRAISDERLLFYQALRLGPAGELLSCEWEPCMTAEQAERIRANRKQRFSGGTRRDHGGLLSNLSLFSCGYCGRSVRSWNGRPQKDGSRTAYYGCKANELKRLCTSSRMILQEIIDEKVATNVFGTIGDTDALQSYWEASQTNDDSAPKLAALEKEGKALALKKQRLIAAIVEGILSFADGKPQREQLDAELSEVARQKIAIMALRQSAPDWDALQFTRSDFDQMDDTDQRQFLALVIKDIRFYSGHLQIEYRFPRNAAGETIGKVNLPKPMAPGPKRANVNSVKTVG